jgi:hypothetical protein
MEICFFVQLQSRYVDTVYQLFGSGIELGIGMSQ